MGDNCVDRYLPPLDLEFVGGNALNVAVGLRDLGHEVAYAGAVGTDDAGRAVLAAARARGIDVTHVQVDEGATGLTTIRLTPDGDRVSRARCSVRAARFRPTAAALADLGRRAWVHGAGLWGGVEGFAGLRRPAGAALLRLLARLPPERMAELARTSRSRSCRRPAADADDAADLADAPSTAR